MRRFAAPTMVGVGAFLIVAAVLLRFYAYPNVAVAPADQDSVTHLYAEDATLFDSSTLTQVTTDLEVESWTKGDVRAAEKAPEDTVVWVNSVTVRSEDGTTRSQSTVISPLDEHTAEAVNCCNAAENVVNGVGDGVEREGLVFKFPFGTEKKDYRVWDDSTAKAWVAKFDREEELHGVPVYVFEMTVPETVVGAREVPTSIFGLSTDEAVEAEETYQVERTFFVEPETGAVFNRIDDQKQTLQYDGDELVIMEGEIQYTEPQVKQMADDYDAEATLLGLVQTGLPIGAGVVGLLLIVGGLVLMRRRTDEA